MSKCIKLGRRHACDKCGSLSSPQIDWTFHSVPDCRVQTFTKASRDLCNQHETMQRALVSVGTMHVCWEVVEATCSDSNGGGNAEDLEQLWENDNGGTEEWKLEKVSGHSMAP